MRYILPPLRKFSLLNVYVTSTPAPSCHLLGHQHHQARISLPSPPCSPSRGTLPSSPAPSPSTSQISPRHSSLPLEMLLTPCGHPSPWPTLNFSDLAATSSSRDTSLNQAKSQASQSSQPSTSQMSTSSTIDIIVGPETDKCPPSSQQ